MQIYAAPVTFASFLKTFFYNAYKSIGYNSARDGPLKKSGFVFN
jgi:hypothetical protein